MSRPGPSGGDWRVGRALGCVFGLALPLGCGPAAPPLDVLRPEFYAVHSAIYGGPGPEAPAAARYDHLAASFAGRALTDAFLEQRRQDRRLLADETEIEVEALHYHSIEIVEDSHLDGDLVVGLSWTVSGEVRHGGHAHARTNRYQARYGLAQTADGWRIVSSQLRGLAQVPGGLGGEAWGADGRPLPVEAPRDPFSLLGDRLPPPEDEP